MDKILSTKTFTCDAGHKVTVGAFGAWVTDAPVCMLCKIVDETVKIAGYVPRFDSKQWELTALTFNAYCTRGHPYEVNIGNISKCVVCERADHIEEDSGFAPELVENYPGTTKFRCVAGHLFMADDRTNGCSGCRCIDRFSKMGRDIKMVSRSTIIWGRYAYLKFNCNKCKQSFYTCQDELNKNGDSVAACPHHNSPVSRTVMMLEKYYMAAFDESDTIVNGQLIRVSGYNKRLKTAVIHTDGCTVDPATVKWCEKNSVRLFRVSTKSNDDIEKSLARQISDSDGAPVEDVVARLRDAN